MPLPPTCTMMLAMLLVLHVEGSVGGSKKHAATSLMSKGSSSPCPELAQEYCHNPALSCVFAEPSWVALRSCAGSHPDCAEPLREWRCYSLKSLNANHTAYKQGTAYCTRNSEILAILKTCKLPPPAPPPAPPAPRVFSNATEVFTPGEGGYPCIRIPSIALAGDGTTLNAFAECRTTTGDGCNPLQVRRAPNPDPAAHNSNRTPNRDICQKQSHDGGATWGPLHVIARGPAAQANPVFDAESNLLILQWVQLEPKDTRQMTSSDHGATWSAWRSVCGTPGMPSTDCGGDVGPGVGIQLSAGPKKGRLLFIGQSSLSFRESSCA